MSGSGTGTLCEICLQEIVIGDDDHEHCSKGCPLDFDLDEPLMPCGHPFSEEELMLETGHFHCTICGADISEAFDGPANEEE